MFQNKKAVALSFCGALLLSACISTTQRPAPVTSYGLQKGAGSTGIHTVASGDTIYNVSERYNLPMRDIIVLNELSPPYRVMAGYRMKLPPPKEYTVRPGDTVERLARTFEVSPSALVRQNDLNAPYALRTGQVLRLPSTVSKPKPKPQVVQASASAQSGELQTASNARVSGVEREELGAPPSPSGSTVKPSVKPKVQKASTPARAKIPDTVPARSGNGKFMRPVGGKIISTYGPKKGGLHNDGINIKVPRGTPVRAAENGVVVYTGDELEGYGNLILVRHADRWMSAYAHLGKTLVQKGDTIKRGQSIGTVGSTGQVDSPQLHFELRRGTKAVDPQLYL